MSISVEAAEARDLLSDDIELISTYERLTALDGKRSFALAAASSQRRGWKAKSVADVSQILRNKMMRKQLVMTFYSWSAGFSYQNVISVTNHIVSYMFSRSIVFQTPLGSYVNP
ncbi:hypothetical protein POM88_013388 [Heracleum sosnowskyi]|uniref:Uncharacterized protein n=1 Tax=Heracleum sosnowskyi TaxID=360622 RepID=A0AAD8J1R3_9APIA|nr:hypothetical protein POM88_013388 [Heracleum sosnowskyi]